MKGQRRHDLEKNYLADWLASTFTAVKPYGNAIWIGVLVLVILAAASTIWSRWSAAGSQQAWTEFYTAMSSNNPTKLDSVSEQFPHTQAGTWATLLAADIYLAEGCEQLFTNKASANQDLQKASERYQTVLQEARTSALREQATFGLARAYEALSGTRQSKGELSQAIEKYEEVVKNWPSGAYAARASRAAEELKRPAVKSFYDKFAQFDPKPAYSPESAAPGQKPSFDLDSLGEPVLPHKTAPAGETKPAGGSETKPAPGGETKPKPASEAKPAPGAKPVAPAAKDTSAPKKPSGEPATKK